MKPDENNTIQRGDVMSNSPLAVYTKISPNRTSPRNRTIDRITPHCVVGQLSAESICGCFANRSRGASCNYGIGTDGRISLCVEEKDRSWCSSNAANDNRAITIECASNMREPYTMNDKVYSSLVDLCVDICKRNGKNVLIWLGDKKKTLEYIPKPNEMIITVHRWFANKSCPGDWLYSRLGDLAERVTARLNSSTVDTKTSDFKPEESVLYPRTPFEVDVLVSNLNYRSLPSMAGRVKGRTGRGTFTIVEVSSGWGKLKSGAGWIWLGNPLYCNIKSKVLYNVRVDISDLNIRKGPGTNYEKTGRQTGVGTFTIVEVRRGEGSDIGWGKLSTGDGWISLDFATII